MTFFFKILYCLLEIVQTQINLLHQKPADQDSHFPSIGWIKTFFETMMNPYPTNIFRSWKCGLLFTSAAYIEVYFRLNFIMGANTMSLGRILKSLILVHINCNIGHQRWESRWQKLWLVGKGWIHNVIMKLQYWVRTANSANIDQTASSEAVWSAFALFASLLSLVNFRIFQPIYLISSKPIKKNVWSYYTILISLIKICESKK